MVGVLLWSARTDWRFFREELSPAGEELRDLLLQRALGWGSSCLYFFGLAIWPQLVGWFVR
jgi:hypothetical protein